MLYFHRGDLAVLVFTYSFSTSVVNNGLRAVHVYCRQIACFLCVCLSRRGRLFLGQICQNVEAKPESKLVRLHLTVLCTLIKHPFSTNQSARYIETFL